MNQQIPDIKSPNVIILNSIYTTTVSRSLGPYLLRHVLEKRGYSCQVIDHCQRFSYDELIEIIEHYAGDETLCLGLSTTFWRDHLGTVRKDSQDSPPTILMQVMEYFKKKYPEKKIILGGAGVRYVTKNIQNIDAFMLGDSEDMLPELLNYWTGRGPEPKHTFWYESDLPVYTECIEKKYDISLCDFQWSDRDAILPNEVLPIETARGCIFKCKFCAYPHLGKKKLDFLRDMDQIKSQMIRNYEKWGVTHYIIVDDTFNDSEHKINAFLEMSRSLPFKLKFWAYIRADLMHHYEGQAQKLKEAGIQGCTIGVETIGPVGSMNIGKGWSGKYAKDYIPKLVHEIWNDDVNVMISIIVGLPGDTRHHCEMTRDWINDSNLSAVFTGLHITHDSKHHVSAFLSDFEKNCEVYGIKKAEDGSWFTKDWTAKTAESAANEYNIGRKIKRIHSMTHVYARTYGLSHEELISLNENELNNQPTARQAIDKYIQLYKKKLLE